jgi:hypothetical protein
MKTTTEKKCDCCGWDDEGYVHEPHCSSLSEVKDKTTTEWEKEYKRLLQDFRSHPENQVSLKYGTKFVNDFHKLLQKALTTQRNELLAAMEEIRMEERNNEEPLELDDQDYDRIVLRSSEIGYNLAVREFNKKLATLKDKYEK